jgi:hypothetical protein
MGLITAFSIRIFEQFKICGTMKTNLLTLIFIFLVTLYGTGQRIYFCDNYTQNGEPIGPNTKVSCPPEGGYIYFLYQNGTANLSAGTYYIHVDKLAGDSYVPFDVKTIASDPSKNWFVYDYKFMTAGDYRITVKNPAQAEMTKDYLNLIAEESSATSSSDLGIDYDDPGSTFYYTYSKLEASTSVNTTTGEIPAAYTSFNIDASLGGRIYFKVSNNGKSIGTTQFVVYIDKKNDQGEFVAFDTKYYDQASSNSTFGTFYYDFYSNGEYNVSVYSGSFVFINTVSLVLNYKQ